MLDFKKIIADTKTKINASKKNYTIFVVVTLVLAWLILGKLGMSIAAAYFICQIPFIRKHASKMKNKKVASAVIVATAVIGFGGIFTFSAFIQHMMKSGMASYVRAPVTITSTKIEKADWQQSINTIGEAQAVQSTGISSQSGGIVSEINFKSGQEVKKGDLLFKLDTSQLKASLEESVSKLRLAKITNDRYKKLAGQRATSKESADQANADYLSALAQVANIESQIGFKEIRAPFDGKIGIRNISLGQFFNNGDNAATLTKVHPIFITFSMPQNKVSMLKKGQNISFYSDTFPGKKFEAPITAINSFINNSNRSIIVQATYKNKDSKIYPGMFLTVQVVLPNKPDSIVVPRNAITSTLYGESLFTLTPILDKDGKPKKSAYTSSAGGSMELVTTDQDLYKVGATNITVLETYNNLALISGIKPGVEIITSGQNKVRKGMNAVVDNSVKFKNDLYTQGT